MAEHAAVVITSLRLSCAVARRAVEPMRRLSPPQNSAIHSFTRIDAPRTAKLRAENATGSGCRIFSKDERASSAPTSRISTETNKPERYSMRAWPNGCSSSAGRSARRKPSSVTSEDAASVRLFRPSAVMDTAPDSVPASSLPADSSTLHTMPTIPASFP